MLKRSEIVRPFDLSEELEKYIQRREKSSELRGETNQALRTMRQARERREAIERGELRL